MSKLRADLHYGAVSMDGEFIEDLIPGYQTIGVTGREALPIEIDSYTTGASDGSTLKNTRYPARELEITFSITGDNPTDIQSKIDHLNNILSADGADFVFNDEADKFYTGTPYNGEVARNTQLATGSWKIFCAYPFKRSIAVFEAEPTNIDSHSAEFMINYNGSYPTKPLLQASFAGELAGGDYSEDGDCGFVAFIDDDENIIQLGNPDAIDIDAYTTADTLINRTFTTLEDWLQSGGNVYENKTITGSMSIGNIADANWNSGSGQTLSFAKPTYGSGNGWHGPILWKSTSGAINFEVSLVQRMCVTDVGQIGTFECGLYNFSGSTFKMVAGYVIEKTSSGTNGTVRYIVNDKTVKTQTIDLSQFNTNFGYCNKTAVYKTQYYNKKKKKWQDKKIKGAKTRNVVSKYTYTQSGLNSSIKKSGSTITFAIGKLASVSFTDTDIELVPVHNVSMHFGQSGSTAAMNTNAVDNVKFVKNPSGNYADIPNVFTSGDVVQADCSDATVYIKHVNTEEGHYEPQYGALGNDWEDFSLSKGVNNVKVVWSDWVNPSYKPLIKIFYNEVYV